MQEDPCTNASTETSFITDAFRWTKTERWKSLPDLRQRIEQLKAESDATDKFVNLIKKYTVIDQLDAAILNELIDKIVVHHKEVAEDGRVFQ